VPLTSRVAWLHQAVYDDLLAQADRHALNETGGLLLGYRHSATEVVITDTIGPGPNAGHRRTGFDPDTNWQTRELVRRYAAADRRLCYLGDWHTHPRGRTALSRIDRHTLGAIARHPDARCPHPVMAVLAGGDPWTLAVRQLTPRPLYRSRIDRLEVQLHA
jgi:integrative and conjugative element protein (TIGR02256 family)